MRNPVKSMAVKAVKPLVGERTWNVLKNPRSALRAWRAARPITARELGRMDLNQLAQHFGTDKYGIHRYTPHYARHLDHLKHESFTLFEIGIGGAERAGDGGASLLMWKHYFSRAQIVGLDIEDKSFIDEDRIRSYQGDQTDPQILQQILADAGEIKVIIDDGSHYSEHIRKSFEILFPLLADDGIYIIEDTQTAYWPEWGGSDDLSDPTTSMALVKSLIDGLNYEEFVDESYEPTYSDLHVVGVHVYHNLAIIEKGVNREGTKRRNFLKERYRGSQRPKSAAKPRT